MSNAWEKLVLDRDAWQARHSDLLVETEALRREVAEQRATVSAARGIVGEAAWPTILRRYSAGANPGSQYGEGSVILDLLPEPTGTYVDVGACHPTECSATWNLYTRGWSGLLVEPLPQHWYPLLRQRPRDRVCPIAVHERRGWAMLRVAGTVSSLRPDWDIASQIELAIETDTLAAVVEEYLPGREVDFLSIDVEGAEGRVLAGTDWSRIRPRAIMVEYRTYHPDRPGEDESATWEPDVLAQGYRVHWQDDLNRIYVRD